MIYTDQLGYLTDFPKTAVSTKPCNFQVIRTSDMRSVLDGYTSDAIHDRLSGDDNYIIDFSKLHEEGEYYILSGDHQRSVTFKISNRLYQPLLKDVLRCLYYQRCGVELKKEQAGVYTHACCHTRPSILLLDYLNHTEDPQEFDMTGGWHDAGDYGRYASAGAVALGHALYAYELFPGAFSESLNIPESGNHIPDILNECMVELKWLFKMQREDGAVYHKLTAFAHSDFMMPEEEKEQYLIFPVSTMATADFTAVMAQASRIYKPFDPEFADRCLDAAKASWLWLIMNEFCFEHNPEGCNTGEYDDTDDTDERLWAAAEMMRSDPESIQGYEMVLRALLSSEDCLTDFGWTDVSGFASLAILTDRTGIFDTIKPLVQPVVMKEADRLLALQDSNTYKLAMLDEDFVWGSNMVVANRGMLLLLASLISGLQKYENAALEHVHYLLGRTPLNISYVTGYGEHAFRNPHARAIASDGIDDPMPGWVSGGPFRTPCDEPAMAAIPKGTPPMKCYIDHVGSYSTNEITIYWNTPLAFILAYFCK